MNPLNAPETREAFLEKAKCYDFLNIVFTDLNGVRREKVVPGDSAEKILEEGEACVICVTAFAFDGLPVMIQDHIDYNFGNITLRPVLNTLRAWPSAQQECGARIGKVWSTAHWHDDKPIDADSRAMAVRQLQRLKEKGLDILMGTEVEFRLFQPQDDTHAEPKPAHDTLNMFLPRYNRQYQKFYTELNHRMRSLGFKFATFHTEFGKGQVEIPLQPEWGILAADNLVRFKMIIDETAQDCGYRCSFMTKPLNGQNGNGFHLNHSIWRRNDDKRPTENVMLDEKDPQKLSTFTRHWIAGLMRHSNALTAITSPTVNCYRRLHGPWAPDYNDWAIDDRMMAIRVKNNGTPQGTYVENRNPSSASNPYLVLAGVIAAGLDGVDRQLELPKEHSKEFGPLPRTLPEALAALLADEVLNKALGSQFIDWFATVKKKEVEDLKGVSIANGTPEDFKRERALYLDMA